MGEIQISAFISGETKREFDRFVEKHGLKKGFVLEQALQLYLRARHEVPEEFIVPVQMRLSRKSFREVAERIAKPPAPTPAMQELFVGDTDED